jgi:hypothetical protein
MLSTAQPGGIRLPDGTFFGIGKYAQWWSTQSATNNSIPIIDAAAYSRYVYYTGSSFYYTSNNLKSGLSIRCIKN